MNTYKFDTNPDDHVEHLEYLYSWVHYYQDAYDDRCKTYTSIVNNDAISSERKLNLLRDRHVQMYRYAAQLAHAENQLAWYARLSTDIYKPEYFSIYNKSDNVYDYDPEVIRHRILTVSKNVLDIVTCNLSKGLDVALYKAIEYGVSLTKMYLQVKEYTHGLTDTLIRSFLHLKGCMVMIRETGMDLYLPTAMSLPNGRMMKVYIEKMNKLIQSTLQKQIAGWREYLDMVARRKWDDDDSNELEKWEADGDDSDDGRELEKWEADGD